MVEIRRHYLQHPDFIGLVSLLDRYLANIDGEDHNFYHQFNTTDTLEHCLVLYENGIPKGCGAIKSFDPHSYEIKRMYVHPEARGKGYAIQLVMALEEWSKELGATRCLLETGKRMPEAVSLYIKIGFTPIQNYGQYVGVANSICFEKQLS